MKSKARLLIETLDEMQKMSSSDFETFRKNVKKVQLKRDKKWYTVKGVTYDKGIQLVGVPEPVSREEIANVARA